MARLLCVAIALWHCAPTLTAENHGVARNLGNDFETFIQAGSCKGPTLVLFVSGASEVRKSFQDAAQEISGLACLGILDCHENPLVCAKQNLQETPAVMLYPTGTRAARLYRGRFSEEGFTAAVAQMIAFNDRTVHLTHRTLAEFLTGRTRPIKVLLFSRRPKTPVIFKALSGDGDLWPHMDFGFIPEEVDNGRNPLLDAYNIETVPQVMVQYGPDLSTKRVYASTDITYSALKDWLLELRAEFWLGRPLWQETELPEPEAELDDPPESHYEILAPGTAGCPKELEIKSVSECQSALKELGMDVDPRWVSNYPELPSKCSVRESPSAEHPERMHFNSFVGGAGRQDLSPVCKKRSSSTSDSRAAAMSTLSNAMGATEIREVDISSLPEQLQSSLQNVLQSLDLSSVELDLEDLMGKLAGNLQKVKTLTADAKPTDAANAKAGPASAAPTDSRDLGRYVKLPKGSEGCPKGTEVSSFDECRRAIQSLGLKPDPYWTSNYDGLPRHCSIRERPGEGIGIERMHFNTANRGQGREDLAPVCHAEAAESRKDKKAAAASKSKGAKAEKTQTTSQGSRGSDAAVPVIQELHGMSQRRLLSKEDYYYLVYMTRGRLSEADENMLLDLKDYFQQRLEESGISLELLWLDLTIERSLRVMLDPPTLPSAMILRGGNLPRYALAQHREEDDEAVVVNEEDLSLMIHQLIGRELRFQSVSAKKLEATWAKRR